MTFEKKHDTYLLRCENAIVAKSDALFLKQSTVSQAAQYSLLNGGKRVRGVLVLAVSDLLNGNMIAADSFATALEMIHAFSLVHDDLPCMDDDDMRRGKPAAHIAFGEATALLAGDALAIQAFEAIVLEKLPAEMQVAAVACLSKAAGAKGMIWGQELDLKYENQKADRAALDAIHRNKTGALLLAAAELGVISANNHIQSCPEISQYAQNVGLVFQIVDDILDVVSTQNILGKPVGSDSGNGKSTFVSLFGLEEAKKQVSLLTNEAVEALEQKYKNDAAFLCEYATLLAARIK